jgi:2-hydroxy-3-oxopropionate reductase
MRIVLETAREYGIFIPSSETNTRLFEQMIDQGMGELDNSAVVAVFEKLAKIGILD